MATPNKTVWNARRSKWALAEDFTFNTRTERAACLAEMRAKYGAGFQVREASYRIGPRNAPQTKYTVRVYRTT